MKLVKHPKLDNIYVTEDGRVFQELDILPSSGGYHDLKVENKTHRRHVIVAETFHGPRPNKGVVRHLDGNPSNDRPDNLKWGTQDEFH